MKELNRNKPVQLRDGRSVRNICWDYKLPDGTIGISAIIRSCDDNYDYQSIWYADGIAYTDNASDLINIPEKYELWINIYRDYNKSRLFGKVVNSKKEADMFKEISRIACVKVTFEEGEGL